LILKGGFSKGLGRVSALTFFIKITSPFES